MNNSKLQQAIQAIENEIRVDENGKGFASIRAVARLCGVEPKALRHHFQGGELEQSRLTESLDEQGFDRGELEKFSGNGVPDTAIAIIVSYYAMDAGRYCTETAKLCAKAFQAIGIRSWIQDLTGWQVQQQRQSLEESYEARLIKLNERKELRAQLKDVYRVELMEAVAKWAAETGANPIKTCSGIHDEMNRRIYGAVAKHIRDTHNIPDNELIREYFPADRMVVYMLIYKGTKNMMLDRGLNPFDALDKACEIALGKDYKPSGFAMEPHLKQEQKSLKAAKKKRQLKANFGIQLSFTLGFPDSENEE